MKAPLILLYQYTRNMKRKRNLITIMITKINQREDVTIQARRRSMSTTRTRMMRRMW
jgi:hypothetical protein